MSLSERFQITVPTREEAGTPFVSFESQRVTHGIMKDDEKFNNLPTIDINDSGYVGKFVRGFGGDTDVSDGITDKALKTGITRYEMKGTDDQYGGEHIDLFYGKVEDEKGNEGFAERNNYLDRL